MTNTIEHHTGGHVVTLNTDNASPIADASKRPRVVEHGPYFNVTCQRGHILVSAHKDEWAGSRAEMLAGLSEADCDRCPWRNLP